MISTIWKNFVKLFKRKTINDELKEEWDKFQKVDPEKISDPPKDDD